MKTWLLFALMLPLLAFFACSRDKPAPKSYDAYEDLFDPSKPISYGEDNDVYLFAAGANLERNAAGIDSSVTRKVLLTVEEQYFHLYSEPIAEIDEFLKYKNLILLGTLSGSDGVSAYLRQTLAPDLQQQVQASGAELFVVKNRYVRDQIIFYLLGEDEDKLAALVSQRADQIFAYLLERYRLRLARQVYQNEVVDARFFEDLPFSIRIPVLYRLFKDDRPGRFLSFLFQPATPNRRTADRYVSVYHEPMPADQIDAKWLFDKRETLGKNYLNGDRILPGKYWTERTKIAGHEGWRLWGHWVNSELGGGVGGAFQTYAFWHAPTQTAYLVDNIVYFPDGEKLPVLLELGMISQSLAVK